MKKKILIFLATFMLVVLFSPRLFILSWATWEYFNTNVVCLGHSPTPPAGLGEKVPVDILEVKPYSVLTLRGYIYPGDEYEMSGDAYWFGMTHLIWAGRDGAIFLVTYESDDPVKGYSRPTCRWFAPVGDYR